ncbi:MAG TPA: hypothetical protein VMF89_23425 [Polyangiales bacterium]|nr:hypothetical protein [Polyangiales bacterium]
MARIELRCALEVGERLRLAIHALEAHGKIVVEARTVRLQLCRLVQRLNRFLQLAEPQQRHSATIVSRREIGLQRHGAAITRQRIGMTAGRVERVAEVCLQYRIAGLNGRCSRECIERFCLAVDSREGDTEQM